jgi:hypothetical protein
MTDTSPAAILKLADEYLGDYENTKVMRDTLLAIAAEKEAQQPVAWRYWNPTDGCWFYSDSELAFEKDSWLAQPLFFTEQHLEMVAPDIETQIKRVQHVYSLDMNLPIYEPSMKPEWKMEDPARFAAPADVPLPEPLFLLHCGALYDGEQDDWDVEANSGKAVDALAREHPNETVWLHSSYDAHQYAEAYAKAAVAAVYEQCIGAVSGLYEELKLKAERIPDIFASARLEALDIAEQRLEAIRDNQKGSI